MARKPRVEFAGALYHVITRGNNRQSIFRDHQDYHAYLRRLETYRGRYRISLYAYVLMPNHVHVLVETGMFPLSKFMQGLQQSYTLYFNRRHRRVGHLFQGRYRAILCDRESYLLELIRYLHLNPVRARIATHPDTYPWSSHHAYLRRPSALEITVDLPLGLLSTRPQTATHRYAQFVREGRRQGHREDFYEVLDQRFLGTEQFAATAKRRAGKAHRRDSPRPLRVSLEQCLALVSYHLGLAADAIRSNARSRVLVHARRLFVLLACRHIGRPVKEVGEFLAVDPSGVTNALRWLERHPETEMKLTRDLNAIMQMAQKARS
jgi:REP element-mobilizing transposase RayT